MLARCRIPQEIFDIIINELRNDRLSLMACSLVASAWRAMSQRLLFREIVLRTSQPQDGPRSTQSLPHRESKPLLLLQIPARLLKYVRIFVIRGDRATRDVDEHYQGLRTPNAHLAGFLGEITTSIFPSLTGVELRDLEWPCIRSDLRRALVFLISGRDIEEVSMVNCDIPFGIRWFRFIGPGTRSYTLKGIKFTNGRDTTIDDNHIPSAPNLINLDLGEVKDREIQRWLLRPCETLDHPPSPGLRSHSWCQSITRLSLQSCDGFLELVEACPNLKTLKLSLLGYTIVPFDLIIRIPTLEHFTISALSPEDLPWFIRSFKSVYLPSPSSHHAAAAKEMVIFLNLSATFGVSASMQCPDALPPMLDQLRALDDAVSSVRNVEVSLNMTLWTFRRALGLPNFKHEETMMALAGLRTHLKALMFHPRWGY